MCALAQDLNMTNTIKILHLANFAFWDEDESRLEIFEQLLEQLKANPSDLEGINAVVVAGDVGANGKSGYKTADHFLTMLKAALPEKDVDFIICPGNRDVNWDEARVLFDINTDILAQAKKFLNPKKLKEFEVEQPFLEYGRFSQKWNKLSVPAYKDVLEDDGLTHGIYISKESELCFLVLNSAWFSLGTIEREGVKREDKGNLFLGATMVRHLTNWAKGLLGDNPQPLPTKSNELSDKDDNNFANYLRVVLVHHPPEYYHESERVKGVQPTDVNRSTVLEQITQFADFVLFGHDAGDTRQPVLHGNNAPWLSTGSMEEAMDYAAKDSCSLVSIDRQNGVLKRKIYWHHRDNDGWNVRDNLPPVILPMRFMPPAPIPSPPLPRRKFDDLTEVEISSLNAFYENPPYKKLLADIFGQADGFAAVAEDIPGIFNRNNTNSFVEILCGRPNNPLGGFQVSEYLLNFIDNIHPNFELTYNIFHYSVSLSESEEEEFIKTLLEYLYTKETEQTYNSFKSAILSGNIHVISRRVSLGEAIEFVKNQ